MLLKLKLLVKKNYPYLEIIIVLRTKIYYLKVKTNVDFFIIDQIYLLEETPNTEDLTERISYYINNEFYKCVEKSVSRSYIIYINEFLNIFLNKLSPNDVKKFKNLYIGNNYHPDVIDFYRSISNL